jgi:Tol biopolymer transport system component
MRSRVAGLGAVLLVLAVGSPTGQAAYPGVEGNVVFVRTERGPTPSGSPLVSHSLYSIVADGSEAALLVDVPAFDPEWSPDGARIAFWADSDPATGFTSTEAELFVVDADGTDLRRLTANERPDRSPTWSPDGSQLAFVRDSAVWIMDVERGRERQVTSGVESVAWSPDGRWLALTRGADGAILVVRPDGSGRRRIAYSSHYSNSRGFGESVDWTPGGRIVFVTSTTQLATMTSQGTGRRRLTKRTSGYEPAWSPDGRWLVVKPWNSDGLDLWSANGLRRRVLTRSTDPVHDLDPDWQPLCVVQGGPTGDSIVGSGQADVICGRDGPDRIDGRGGLDRIFGGAGNDVLVAVDGRFDVVGCGAGRDLVRADRVDLVGVDCERVRRV